MRLNEESTRFQVQIDQGSEYVADLVAQLAKKERQISENAESASRLERECIELREHLADERQRTVEIEDARLQLTAQFSMLQDELMAERDRQQQVVQQLQVQVDQGSEYVADLLEQLAEKERQISENAERASQLEREFVELREHHLAEIEATESHLVSDEMPKRAKSAEANLAAAVRKDEKLSQNKPAGDRSLKHSRAASTRLKGEMDRLKLARMELDKTLGRARSE